LNAREDFLAGRLQLLPGQPMPAVRSTQGDWVSAIVRGRPAEGLPALLAGLLPMCGGAHRLTARAAVDAALGEPTTAGPEARRALQADTMREHLRRLWLDWPRALDADADAPSAAALADCPLLQAARTATPVDDGAAIARTVPWLERHVFGEPLAHWLADWIDDPQRCMVAWSDRGDTAPARLVQRARVLLGSLRARLLPLRVHATSRELERLADDLRSDAGFVMAPSWRGRTAETGAWTRCADRFAGVEQRVYELLWMRLASRIAELARLADPSGGELWLGQGSITLGPWQGLAWCETARGLLVHWVWLEPSTVADQPARIADCRVLAPTEWNFHPFGPVARAASALPPSTGESRVRALAAAFDPCVGVDVLAPRQTRRTADA
jgi:hypothetical protein